MSEDLYSKLYEDRTFADVTFVLEGNEEKAHRCVLADRCSYFKQYFDQNNSNVININGARIKIFKELVKFCYLQQIDLAHWSDDDKECLYNLATAYQYGPLMDIVQHELEIHPEVSPSVDTLNEWFENNRGEELRGWIRNNILNIVKYEDCHKYTKDLISFILDIFNEMCDNKRNKFEQRTEQKELLKWLFRWRNWSNREEVDVNCIFLKLSLNFMSNDLPAWEAPIRMKLSEGVCHFVWFREVKTAGWECDDQLKLLCFAHFYDFGLLFDVVLNVVTTQHLEPSSFTTIYAVARKLESSKLEQALVDYLRNNTNSIFTSAQFTNYPANVIVFLYRNLSCQLMDLETPFHHVIEYCYMQKIDFTHWTFSDKIHLLDFAKMYNYQSLINLIKPELEKCPTVPLTVASLNEWYENISEVAIREWVKNNLLKIVNYEDNHKYHKDLVVLIMNTICELANKEMDKQQLESPLKKLLLWLFRWRNWCDRKEDDVQSLFCEHQIAFSVQGSSFGG